MNKEKNKNKPHPFAGVLRETEDVLWMGTQANTTTLSEILRMGLALDVGMALFLLFFIAFNGYFIGYNNQTLPWIALGTLVLCLPIAGVIVFFTVRSRHNAREIYAVTNERLLRRSEQDVKGVPLESVSTISLLPGNRTTGTLSFGPMFPMWSDLEEAAHVKKAIEEARAARVQS